MKIKNLTKLVLEYLRNRIITGELIPGQKLNENEIASRLEISRHSIREAFRVLESEQLVFSITNKGAFVTELSVDDLVGVTQTREMIECYAVELLKRQKNRDFHQLESAIEDASNLSIPLTDDPEQYLEYHRKFVNFHFKMIEACGNSRLLHFYKSISLNLARYQFKSLRLPGSLETNQKEHRQILNALKIGDYKGAKEKLKFHITKRLHGTSKIRF